MSKKRGKYCDRCGKRVYLVESPDGFKFWVTSSVPGQKGGEAICREHPMFGYGGVVVPRMFKKNRDS